MATELDEMVLRLSADVKEYTQAMQQIIQDTKKTADEVTGLGAKIEQFGQTLGAAIATIGISAWLREAAGAWEEAETTVIRLNAVLGANGQLVTQVSNDYQDFALEIQNITTLGDEAVLNLLTMAETFGLTGDAAKQATQDAIALAAVNNTSAEAMIRITAAMADGDTERAMMFSRMIPQLRGVKDKTEFVAKFQALTTAGWKTAQQQAETFSGRLKQLKETYSNFMEIVGKSLADVLKPLVEFLRAIAFALQQIPQPIVTLVSSFGLLAVGILGAVGVWKVFAAMGSVLSGVVASITGLILAKTSATTADTAATAANTVATAQNAAATATSAAARRAELASMVGPGFAGSLVIGAAKLGAFAVAGYAVTKMFGAMADAARITQEALQDLAEIQSQLMVNYKDIRDGFSKEAKSIKDPTEATEKYREQWIKLQRLMAVEQKHLLRAIVNAARGGEVAEQALKNVKERLKVLNDALKENEKDWQKAFDAAITMEKLKQLGEGFGVDGLLDGLKEGAKGVKEFFDQREDSEALRNFTQDLKDQMETMEGLSQDELKLRKIREDMKHQAEFEPGLQRARQLLEEKKALEQLKKAQEDAKAVFEQTRTPLEKYDAEIFRLGQLVMQGALQWDAYARAVAQAYKTLQDASPVATKAMEFGSAEAIAAVQQHFEGPQDRGDPVKELKKANELLDVIKGGVDAMGNALNFLAQQ